MLVPRRIKSKKSPIFFLLEQLQDSLQGFPKIFKISSVFEVSNNCIGGMCFFVHGIFRCENVKFSNPHSIGCKQITSTQMASTYFSVSLTDFSPVSHFILKSVT